MLLHNRSPAAQWRQKSSTPRSLALCILLSLSHTHLLLLYSWSSTLECRRDCSLLTLFRVCPIFASEQIQRAFIGFACRVHLSRLVRIHGFGTPDSETRPLFPGPVFDACRISSDFHPSSSDTLVDDRSLNVGTMFSSRKFLFLFFVLTTLLSTGSARGLFFWARQNNGQDGNNGGNTGNLGNNNGGTTDVTSEAVTLPPTSSVPATTSDSQTSIPQSTATSASTSAPVSTPTTTSKTDSTTTPESFTSTTPTTTPATSSEVTVVETSTVSGTPVPVTHTTPASSTATNGLASNSGSSSGSSSGMTQQQKSVAIGVGVGVGGAILLGGLAIVAWRMWGRKKHNPEEDHFLMDDPLAEKPNTPSTAASPFKSTLDQYHNPAGRLNTAANF